MPAADDIIKALPTLTFIPADEVPAVPSRWYLIYPGDDDGNDGWAIAERNSTGWFGQDGGRREPLVCAALPSTPLTLKAMAVEIGEMLGEGRFSEAAKLIDELADEVRALRDSPLAR